MSARIRCTAPLAAVLLACGVPRAQSPSERRESAESYAAETSLPAQGDARKSAHSGDARDERGTDSDDEDDGEETADDVEATLPPDAVTMPHPLDGVSAQEIERRVTTEPESLGSMSVGRPNAGRLFNGVQMPEGEAWEIVAPGAAWATEETVQALTSTITKVFRAFPNSPRLPIGDISVRFGGYLTPHLSHQAGRDVDIGYYYQKDQRWYRRATADNLDLARTWAFVRAVITETDVEMLLIDHSIQALLRDHAARAGEDAQWLELIFKGKGSVPPLVRHAKGHATHIHIRFYSPLAQETARRAYSALVAHGKLPAGASFVTHVARKGDTLARLAKRFHTTVRAIRQANGLRSNAIVAKRTYRIPTPHHTAPAAPVARVVIPPRRLPPGEKSAPRQAGPESSPRASL